MYAWKDRQGALRRARRLSAWLWLLSAVVAWCIIDYVSFPGNLIVLALGLTCIIISKRIGILTGRYNLPEKDVDLITE